MMPKVSVVMNCFNGERYLKEALDSVFRQTYEDWELIFVDNCSQDKSIEIAGSYGDKVTIIRNKQTVPLGESRNIGIRHCSGQYIAFLDVDDIWFEDALEKQLQVMGSGDYAIAYGGHLNIDSSGEVIGEWSPSKKAGYVFPQLLKQFDIPIVTSMISRKVLEDSCLMFDNNVHASEEYCLFMQLSACYPIICIEDKFTKYRIHDDALTNKSIDKWAKERRYTLDKIKSENEGLEKKYPKEFQEAYARAAYYDAQYFMFKGDRGAAVRALSEYKSLNKVFFILYMTAKYFPFVWHWMQKRKYKRVY